MKERPILFSGPMVRAILEGRKTQTRRVVKRQGDMEFDPADPHFGPYWLSYATEADGEDAKVRCPYGVPGDRLWVRETFAENAGTAGGIVYRADVGDSCHGVARLDLKCQEWTHHVDRWRPSIFMPRRFSRILLEITGVRVERLQDISDDDCRAEGYDRSHAFPREWFARLWASINGPGSWAANPWVWVVSFRRVEAK
jgi:hypothetical protein